MAASAASSSASASSTWTRQQAGGAAAPAVVAVVGAGMSGIAAAAMLQKEGHTVVLFEKTPHVGGVWAYVKYPDVSLQCRGFEYYVSDFPWPFAANEHPTGPQVQRYLVEAAAHYKLDVRPQHEVVSIAEEADYNDTVPPEQQQQRRYWKVSVRRPNGVGTAAAVAAENAADAAAHNHRDTLAAAASGLEEAAGAEASTSSSTTTTTTVHAAAAGAIEDMWFDYVFISTGQYTGRKVDPGTVWPGVSAFTGSGGRVLTETDVYLSAKADGAAANTADGVDEDLFRGKRVVVVGFGKSALDMTVVASKLGAASVTHVFRQPRMLVFDRLLGVTFETLVFPRSGTSMITCWQHPPGSESFLHRSAPGIVRRFWSFVSGVAVRKALSSASNAEERERVLMSLPPTGTSIIDEMRSAVALAPNDYFPFVAKGKVQPMRGNIEAFQGGDNGPAIVVRRTAAATSTTSDGATESNNPQSAEAATVACDLVITAIGSGVPTFPFLPAKYQEMLLDRNGGPNDPPEVAQLYRHIIHPHIPRLFFAGANHGFQHVPSVEIGALWASAVIRGDLALPSTDEMDERRGRVAAWKRKNQLYEPSRNFAANTRFQQYNDCLMIELGLSPQRKWPFAETFSPYTPGDYATIQREFDRQRARRNRAPLPSQPFDM